MRDISFSSFITKLPEKLTGDVVSEAFVHYLNWGAQKTTKSIIYKCRIEKADSANVERVCQEVTLTTLSSVSFVEPVNSEFVLHKKKNNIETVKI